MCTPMARPVDVYEEHQRAWDAVHGIAMRGIDFQYRWDRMLKVRTRRMLAGAKRSALPRTGRFEIRMLCARQSEQSGGRYIPVPEAERAAWMTAALASRGIIAQDITCAPLQQRVGMKSETAIKLPVVDFAGAYAVSDYSLAWTAYQDGIGRAKRFGCGMLVCVESPGG